MPITKTAGVVVESEFIQKALFDKTGVAQSNEFAVCDPVDKVKQIAFDPAAQATNTKVTLKSGANSADITLTLPATSGTLATTSGAASFTTMQTPAGTAPVATGPSDVLTFTSTGNTVTITGNSTTDTINLEAAAAGVTSVGLSLPAEFTVSNSPVTSTGTLTGVWTTQTANKVMASATSGGAATPAFRALVGADIPNPSSSTLGGVQSKAAVTSNFLTSISTSGVPAAAQPAFTDISGTATAVQGGTGMATYVKGDVVTATATNTLGVTAIGTTGQINTVLSTGLPGWKSAFDISTRTGWVEDFVFDWGSNLIGSQNWRDAASGTGTAVGAYTGSGAANPGVHKFDMGTTTTGLCYLVSSNSSNFCIQFGAGTITLEYIVGMSALSDGTDTYSIQLGLGLVDTTLSPVNAIYMVYSSAINSGAWTLRSTKASTATSSSTGVAATTGFQRVGFQINAAGTSIQGLVAGVAQGTPITTNIPIVNLQFLHLFLKSAGTTSRTVYLDAIGYETQFTTGR